MSKRVLDVGQCGPDHATIRTYLTRNFDCEVVQVDDAAGALSELKSGPFDLVLVNRKLDCDYSDGLEVIVRGERPAREVTRRTVDRREIERIPGTGGDALRSIQNLPGVARPPGLSGLLVVRGSGPQDTATFIDGVVA